MNKYKNNIKTDDEGHINELETLGISDESQAYKEGYFKSNNNRRLLGMPMYKSIKNPKQKHSYKNQKRFLASNIYVHGLRPTSQLATLYDSFSE